METTPEQRKTILRQIGHGTILSVSGGRVGALYDGVEFTCGYGYRVRVHLTPADTYTVQRVLVRGVREWVKGEQTDVHWPELAEVVYRAGMFRDAWAGGGVTAASLA